MTFSPRSLSAIELVEQIKLEIRSGTLERALQPLVDRLDDLIREVEEERRNINSAIVAGEIFKRMLPVYQLTKDFESAPEPLRSQLLDMVNKGEYYEVHNNQ